MKNIRKMLVSCAVIVTSFGLVISYANAMTPTLSVNQTNGSSAVLGAYGDANAPVTLYYGGQNNSYGNWQSAGVIGTTDGSGFFSKNIDANSYSIPSGASVYVTIDGQQSQSVTWPNYNNYNSYYSNNAYQQFSLSSNSVTLAPGQSQSVQVGSSQPIGYSVTATDNSGVATASANGNSITFYGNYPGTTSFQVCQSNSSNGCATISVTVANNAGVVYVQGGGVPPIAGANGVYLNQVPYTGIGSNAKVFLFMLALALWTAGLSYLLVRRKMNADNR